MSDCKQRSTMRTGIAETLRAVSSFQVSVPSRPTQCERLLSFLPPPLPPSPDPLPPFCPQILHQRPSLDGALEKQGPQTSIEAIGGGALLHRGIAKGRWDWLLHRTQKENRPITAHGRRTGIYATSGSHVTLIESLFDSF